MTPTGSPARTKWLEAADDTFRRYGFHKTSMEDIARKARKAKGSLYYHFGSKEGLFAEVVGQELSGLRVALTAVFDRSDRDARTLVRDYMLVRMKVLRAAPNYQETLRPEFYEHHRFFDAHKRALAEWEIGQLTAVLERGVLRGELELDGPLEVYAQVLTMLLQGLEASFFLQGEYDRLEMHFDNLIQIITKGISPSI